MVKRNDFVFGAPHARNDWAKAHHTEGAQLIDGVVDVMRKEGESCNCLQGFEITHSRGGDTCSGLATLLLMKIRDNDPNRISITRSIRCSCRTV